MEMEKFVCKADYTVYIFYREGKGSARRLKKGEVYIGKYDKEREEILLHNGDRIHVTERALGNLFKRQG